MEQKYYVHLDNNTISMYFISNADRDTLIQLLTEWFRIWRSSGQYNNINEFFKTYGYYFYQDGSPDESYQVIHLPKLSYCG